MKVESDPRPLLDHVEHSARASIDDVQADAVRTARRRSGRHAAGIQQRVEVLGDRIDGAVGGTVPYAGALERGADVGPRRGPHMEGDHAIRDAGDRFLEHMTNRLRSAG